LNIIPLRREPVTVPPPPFAPGKFVPTPAFVASGSKNAKSRYLLSLDAIAQAGSARRERLRSTSRSKSRDSARHGGGHGGAGEPEAWRSCANPQPYFTATATAKAAPERKPRAPLTAEEREHVIARLTRVPPPRKPLPPLVARWRLSEEDEAALVERLVEPFERPEPEPAERKIIEDEVLEEMITRLYREPQQKLLELREARGY
jgi:hypothetical protein